MKSVAIITRDNVLLNYWIAVATVNTMTPLLSTKCVVGGVKNDKVGERRNLTRENTGHWR